MDSNLFSFLVLAAVAVVTPTAILLLSFIAGPLKKKLATKLTPYECGVKAPTHALDTRFSIRYYLVAVLFVVFDVETIFLFPWAVVLDQIGMAGFWAMMIFLGILVVGFIYEWKKGALEWE